ncbi:dephospho-CoA kinase [Bifidobacterium actinocoloniiforme DSM 22766]|uniref:Dephospho-CoA kinase n=1 Tax=Bifidobacterium actinocoloniiforme DSM 22766 TaxID=1437605 RepID=A0A086Z040_9BIFI|nr:dephospho-CoA kinase [Bifidobacterium actinocoloniiforme]AKV55154.1 hypothetical protein AB656_01555 [Bifidobacterium actinocoloniiforme DSM 22766]KFI39890.1 dephospho-CoA kinase [Bifidobacterium actinocoloniiforme DSM 22766]
MLRVGLTGGIAAGKSTVSRRLGELGAWVIDYDRIAHRIMEAGGAAVEPIRKAFGGRAIGSDGSVDRAWLADRVFASGDLLARLDALTHPLIRQQAMHEEEPWRGSDRVVVHDIPLLTEIIGSIPLTFDRIITVEAPEQVRVARMVNERHMSRSQAIARVNAQASEADRRGLADTVIDSSLAIEQMFEQVDTIYEELSHQAQTQGEPGRRA